MMIKDEMRKCALKVIRKGPDALIGPGASGASCLDGVWVFSQREHDQLKAFRELVLGYVLLAAPARPLCLSVLGPPGSGKSFGVGKIIEALSGKDGPALPLHEINLTQLTSTDALAREVALRLASSSPDSVPVFFFDEFDAPLRGKALGWLSWFLAPMHDGCFLHDGIPVRVLRAIFVFVGGTADRLADFESGSAVSFAAAKGPDFVSRLRGFLDVPGLNHREATDLRRAILLHAALGKVDKARFPERAPMRQKVNLSRALCVDLLNVGRFRHGARSLEAIVEMTAAQAGIDELAREHLPGDHLLALHVDRGPLDIRALGGLIGLSGGGQDKGYSVAWATLAEELWRRGATLAYGGDRRAGGLVGQLRKLSRKLPRRLAREDKAVDEPRLVLFPHELAALSGKPPEDPLLDIVAPPATGGLSEMRWRMACRCVARVLVGGRAANYTGRMPGLFEEAAMSLLQEQPVYILGGFGGAAAALAALLGLSNTCAKVPAIGAPDSKSLAAERLNPHGAEVLPADLSAAIGWIPGFALGGPLWPDNGLNVVENRELAATTNHARIIDLVIRGLERRFRSPLTSNA